MKIACCLFVLAFVYATEICTASPTEVTLVTTTGEERNQLIDISHNTEDIDNNEDNAEPTDAEVVADVKKVKKLCKRACRKKKGGKYKLGKCGRRKRYKWICVFCRVVYQCGKARMGTYVHP